MALVALVSLVLTVSSSVYAGPRGATQIEGVGRFAVASDNCTDLVGADLVLKMTGDLDGCHYIFVQEATCSPSGTYNESGVETFVGNYMGTPGRFDTTYLFTAKFVDCPNLVGEIWGRCEHPIVAGSGTGVFDGVTGRFDIKDDVDALVFPFPYTGHLRK